MHSYSASTIIYYFFFYAKKLKTNESDNKKLDIHRSMWEEVPPNGPNKKLTPIEVQQLINLNLKLH